MLSRLICLDSDLFVLRISKYCIWKNWNENESGILQKFTFCGYWLARKQSTKIRINSKYLTKFNVNGWKKKHAWAFIKYEFIVQDNIIGIRRKNRINIFIVCNERIWICICIFKRLAIIFYYTMCISYSCYNYNYY